MTSRQSLPPVSALTHLGEASLHTKEHAKVRPVSKAAGLLVHVTVSLDPERQSQWDGCPDFRRALRENLAETYPAADRVVLTGRGLRTLETFRPEDHLPDENEETTRFVRTAVVRDPGGRVAAEEALAMEPYRPSYGPIETARGVDTTSAETAFFGGPLAAVDLGAVL